ncbi:MULTISPECIES: ROK family transcriptional regulator [unclassified Rhizobacter]|uniref:ROK family transcriptional regulator n=1 Tax=unclassified Rhizobacter TaxID=2640088 RepID=UPI0006FD4856|nr:MULTISPECIES: ROK family transcriptional regulator [unclassified Rhizobacter]KQU78466.1 serine/threonine protein kinase [Rhizobacter sp. Root29]KQW10986.1 serine/threonine protein kinase [Rhizobacter sp. Root1238]KRB25332.1 serine/threonine protein kinase [Rhizobacter sp. Root16D2]
MTELQSSRLRPRGSNHVGMRQFNERVVLQAIRLHGALPKAEIARLTHLTPQTVQLIIGRLEGDGLVVKQAPVRGKVGQPSVPMALNPDGAFSIGIKIGRRGMDMLLVDFTGQVRERLVRAYAFPDPRTLFDEIADGLAELRGRLGPERARVLHGVGVAAPLSLGGWESLLGLSAEAARAWALIDIRARVAALTELPVVFVKDTAAACVAELVAGRGRSMRSYLYIFVDTFIGGGLVLDSHLRGGVSGNAGAVGSLALGANDGSGLPRQLLSLASLFDLEARWREAGLAEDAWLDERALSAPWLPITEAWLRDACPGIALAVHTAACLLDLEGVIIDGSFGRGLLAALLRELTAALDGYSWEGVARPEVLPGTIGSDARAMGGALLPLYANFAPDRDLFLKLEP